MDELKQKEIPPTVIIAAIAVGVLVIFSVVFFAFIKPKMESDRALADFNSPEAQAKRDPDQRKFDPGFVSKISELKAKEQQTRGVVRPAGVGRRRE